MNFRGILILSAAALLLGSGWWVRSEHSGNFQSRFSAKVTAGIAAELSVMEREGRQLLNDSLSPRSAAWDMAEHSFFRFDSGRVKVWNHNDFLPDPYELGLDSIAFISSVRGDFLLKRWYYGPSTSLVGVITLASRYPITNSFLSNEINPLFKSRDFTIVNPWSTIGVPIRYHDHLLFRVVTTRNELHENLLSFLLLLCGFSLAMWGWWKLIRQWKMMDGVFMLLVAGFWAGRQIMQNVGVPSRYFQSDLFDPKKFASSALNSSMGDLFLNAVCLLIVMLFFFRNFRKFRSTSWLLHRTGPARLVAGGFCFLACFFAVLFPYNFVEVIYHNSSVSLDITQSISFDAVRWAALFSVLMACFSSFLFFHVFYSIGRKLTETGWMSYLSAIALAALVFFIQFQISGQDHSISWVLGSLLLILLRLYRSPENFQFSGPLFFYLICSLFVFSLQNAWSVKQFSEERQSLNQIRYAKGFLTDRDILGEYLLDQARSKIQQDPFIKTRMSGPVYGISAVVDKIRRVHLNRYFDRYEIRIDVLPGDAPPDTIKSVFHATGYEGVSYSIATEGNDLKKYNVQIPLSAQRPIGNIQLHLTLKRIIPDNVYPELLVDNRFSQVYRNKELSYAVFKGDALTTQFGAFNYRTDFNNLLHQTALFTEGVDYLGFHHQAVEDTDGSVAVVSAPAYTGFFFLADLSFWFVLGLAVLLIYQAIMGLIRLSEGVRFNYAARIQLFIFLAFFLPVVAVSITTLTLIGRSSEETIKRDFLDRSEAIGSRLSGILSGDTLKLMENLEVWIEENSAAGKFDITVYSPGGSLMATSQPTLFDDKLISPLMDHTAWRKLVFDNESRIVTNEQIGKLQYSCAYAAVNSSDGKLLAIVGLPFFESAAFLQKNEQLILSNILIIFIIVFLLFSVLSFWASGSLTSPIRIIARAIGQTTLTGANKPIEWNSNDEIGVLVNEYNKMVSNLEESKRALARSEKESAWREMARQVAHEIKNPLTPMKLTLQQMEQSGELPSDKMKKSVEVLLRQVEILNQIASSFSSFASMPATLPQRVDLFDLIRNTILLFDAQKDGEVVFHPEGPSLTVVVDPTSFGRAISNIVINALQSRRNDQSIVRVIIEVSRKDQSAIISIQDTGKGMSSEIKEKIFEPQFTTKHSGSGLGLALTRQIVTQAGGRIWFESEEGVGSRFFIELPISH